MHLADKIPRNTLLVLRGRDARKNICYPRLDEFGAEDLPQVSIGC